MAGYSLPVDFIHDGEHRSVFVTIEHDEQNQPFMKAETQYDSHFEFVYRLGLDGSPRFYYRGKEDGSKYLNNLGFALVRELLKRSD